MKPSAVIIMYLLSYCSVKSKRIKRWLYIAQQKTLAWKKGTKVASVTPMTGTRRFSFHICS